MISHKNSSASHFRELTSVAVKNVRDHGRSSHDPPLVLAQIAGDASWNGMGGYWCRSSIAKVWEHGDAWSLSWHRLLMGTAESEKDTNSETCRSKSTDFREGKFPVFPKGRLRSGHWKCGSNWTLYFWLHCKVCSFFATHSLLLSYIGWWLQSIPNIGPLGRIKNP